MVEMLHDPIEDDPLVKPLYLAICDEVSSELHELRNRRGTYNRLWARIKELMLERHGIEWRSPREMNPTHMFD